MKSVLEVYSEISKANPPWTPDEERAFVKKWWRKDREHFVNEAMKHNLGLVFKAMQKVAFNPKSEDVFQRAVSALVESLRKFKPSKGYRISTWVSNPVRWAIQQFQNPYNHQGSIRDEITSLNNRYGSKMSVVSIDAKVGGDDGDGDTVGDLITDSNISTNYLVGICKTSTSSDEEKAGDIQAGVSEMLAYMPKVLTKNELYVIKRMLRGKNMSEISVELKLSRMRISQITAKAFEKIRRSKFGRKLKGLVSQ
jgi:RNA polymerase sigma factor (sigma-70 family)